MKKVVLFIILILLVTSNVVFANSQMNIVSDKQSIEIDEEIEIKIHITDVQISSLTLEIFYDTSKLEYISGPENSNYSNARIIYTWVDYNGKNKEEINIETFKFKGKIEGSATIAVVGEFYNSDGEKVEINSDSLNVEIENTNTMTDIENIVLQNEETTADSTNLRILRLNHEGISPVFDKNIKEYYFVTDKEINNLEVTAVPDNSDAKVTVDGNNNLKNGENTINIQVTSKDNTKTATYKIYVTKTTDIQSANANLETLAIRESSLSPEFSGDMTRYETEISNNTNKIDILAIPVKENATVTIVGNDEMKVGDNKIEISVLAENGTTMKKYEINVHRRNEEEEKEYQENKQINIEKLSYIEEQEDGEDHEEDSIIENVTKNRSYIIGFMIMIVLVSIIILLKKVGNKFKWKRK